MNEPNQPQSDEPNESPGPETPDNESQVSSAEPAVEPTIHLDQFLKTCGVATGGQAKRMIQGGEILLNGVVETRRRKQLRAGDEITWGDTVFVVALS